MTRDDIQKVIEEDVADHSTGTNPYR